MISSFGLFVRKHRTVASIGAIGFLLTGFFVWADDTVVLPGMTVVGKRQEDGGPMKCATALCFDSANQEALQSYQEWQQMYDSIPPDDLPLNGARFCSNLAGRKPGGCSLSSPPASPGISVPGQPQWAANGCGTGPLANAFLSQIVNFGYGDVYTGDLNNPYPGVSFRGACDAHDACWGQGNDRTWCDIQFESRLENACEVVTSTSGWGSCRGLASAYHAAVSTDMGTNVNEGLKTERTCALWALEMRENKCSPS